MKMLSSSQHLICYANNIFIALNIIHISEPTWCEEAVEVTDNSTKRGPERRLIIHAAGY